MNKFNNNDLNNGFSFLGENFNSRYKTTIGMLDFVRFLKSHRNFILIDKPIENAKDIINIQSGENNVFVLYDNNDKIIGIIKFDLNEIIIINKISEFFELPLNSSNASLFYEIEKYLNKLGYFFEGDFKEVYFSMDKCIDFKHNRKKGYARVCILEVCSKSTVHTINKEEKEEYYSIKIEIIFY